MSCPFDEESLNKLKQFIKLCSAKPDVLLLPEFDFFRNFIESLGGKIPPRAPTMSAKPPSDKPEEMAVSSEGESESESDVELDTEGCIEPDIIDESRQKMGDPEKEVTEEDGDKSSEKRMEAMSLLSENIEGAINLLTEAIELNPLSGALFAKRGQAYLKSNKPIACIKDCTRALELNPDSAVAFKFRGRAYRLLGKWEEAAKDLRQACNIDFDEQIDEWLKEVTPNARKIEQHRLKQENKRLDKEEREKLKRYKQAQEAHAKASAQAKQSESATATHAETFAKMAQDPDIEQLFSDPEVREALASISQNPDNMEELAKNPKVMAAAVKIMGKLGPAGMQQFFGQSISRDLLRNLSAFSTDQAAGAAPPTRPDDDNLD